MSVTSKQIAELANVSRGTVDRALNDRGGVNAEVAARIKHIANDLGYVPNQAASALAKAKKKMEIGVVLPAHDTSFFEKIKEGISSAVNEFRIYNVEFLITHLVGYSEKQQLDVLEELLEKQVKAILIAPVNSKKMQLRLLELTDKGIRIINLNTDLKHTKRLCYVGHDYYKSGATAEGLIALMAGSDAKTGIILPTVTTLGIEQRLDGFYNNKENHGHTIKIAEVIENINDDIDSYTATKKLIRKYPELKALLLVTPAVYGCGKAIKELGAFKAITTVAFDDDPKTLQMILEGNITATISQDSFDQGYIAAKLIFRLLINNEFPDKDKFHTAISIKIRENL